MMTTVMGPRLAVEGDATGSIREGELATLVRRWMAVGSKAQDRVRRDSTLRVLPEAETEASEPADTEESVDLIELGEQPGGTPAKEREAALGFPPLPRRHTGQEPEPVARVALLVDARRVSADVASGLVSQLAERRTVSVCRAYADWDTSDVGDWVGRLPREGLHSFHHFADDDDQALVAMAIDAIDIARDAAVDEVVIAGDLTSSLPLVHRLHAAGVRVVAAGSAHTPYDVRSACDEFIDTSSIEADAMLPVGRHRA